MINEKFQIAISPTLTLRQCIERIRENKNGFVFLVDQSFKAIGLLTDGDVRNAFLSGATTESLADLYVNRNFRSLPKGATREQLLRLLDYNIKFVPIIDDGRIVDIKTTADLHYTEQEHVIARSKSPARISFGGGGTDLTSFFLTYGGAVLNATIDMYAHCTLKRRNDPSIRIFSHDYNRVLEVESAQSLRYDGNLDLIKAAIKLLNPSFGFELEVGANFPPSSGLGGSSVVAVAVIGCFNQLRSDKLDTHAIAELAFQAERIELNHSGGWQDQYASAFGGFNFMEFRTNRNEINTLKISSDVINELEDRLLLCYSGKSHPFNSIHAEQKRKMVDQKEITKFAERARDIAYEMKFHLIRGNLQQFGYLMHENWTLKKNFSSGISDPELDSLYDFGVENGAVGGKILGAGGGGYFLFQAASGERRSLMQAFASKGLETRTLKFDNEGLRSWLVRD
ncbi:MAG: CBS domain-containing protein [Oligoflexales bacterium]